VGGLHRPSNRRAVNIMANEVAAPDQIMAKAHGTRLRATSLTRFPAVGKEPHRHRGDGADDREGGHEQAELPVATLNARFTSSKTVARMVRSADSMAVTPSAG